MSNKRSPRRKRQRVRSEVSRKPKVITKAKSAFIGTLAADRKRKELERYRKRPTKAERLQREKQIRHWRLRGPTKWRKPRTNTRLAGHDLNN